MKANFILPRVFLNAIFFLLGTLLFVMNDCKAQQINNDYKLIASINSNPFGHIESEQIFKQEINERIIKHLKLSLKEKELLIEIKQLSIEAKQCLNDADMIAKGIYEINKNIINTDENSIGYIKSERKIKRQKNYESSIRYDAEELFEISNSLLFKIYEDHFPSSGALLIHDNANQQQISDLYDQAQELIKKAKENQDKAIYDLNYKTGLDYLKKANYLKREAIKKLELAYSLYYNIPIKNKEYNKVIPDLSSLKEQELIVNNTINTSETNIDTSFVNENIESNNKYEKSCEVIIYRVQIGAFTKKVDVTEFHGLYPLTKDNKDQKEYLKYMVGEYFSYKAASEAKRIIASTTKHKDSFVVAYKNGERVSINSELIK